MISIHSLNLDERTADLLVLSGCQWVKDVLLFNTKELMDFLKIGRKRAKQIIRKSLKAKAEEDGSAGTILDGFLKQGGYDAETVAAGIEGISYPRQGITQLIGAEEVTDRWIKKWVVVRGDVLIIDCLSSSLSFELPVFYSLRRAICLDELTLMIDFLVRDVKDYKINGIVVRGFLNHLKALEQNKLEKQKVVKRLGKHLERLSEAYTLPVLISTRETGGSSLSQSVKKRFRVHEFDVKTKEVQ